MGVSFQAALLSDLASEATIRCSCHTAGSRADRFDLMNFAAAGS
jgi:hypothetical protein